MEKLTKEMSFLRKLMEIIKTDYSNLLPVDIALVKRMVHLFLILKHPGKKFCRRWRYSQKKEAFAALPELQVIVKDTVQRWMKVSSKHCKEVTDYFFRDLKLNIIHIDEIWSYIKKKKKMLQKKIQPNVVIAIL